MPVSNNQFSKISIGSCKFMQLLLQLLRRILYSYSFLEFLDVLPALSCTHRITFACRFVCIGRMSCTLPKPASHPLLLS